ncbi:MAG: glycosyltransferase family 2 protein [Pseudomonadota bacterium]
MALTHNEANILQGFLDHYRALGVHRFLIVDDNSTDETRDILSGQDDVIVFKPAEGTSYKEHKRFWRSEILDDYCSDNWCVVPDMDEHLVYAGMGERSLSEVATSLDADGYDAVHGTMIDMYQDAPLSEHSYNGGSLAKAFPLFDGPDHYFRLPTPSRFRKKYPAPFYMVIGGMRQRVFLPYKVGNGDLLDRVFRKHADIGGPIWPSKSQELTARFLRAVMRGRVHSSKVFNMTKVPFLKWRRGLYFHGGAHNLSQKVNLSPSKMGLLHFNFASGLSGVERRLLRGQHARGSRFYKTMRDQEAQLQASPVFGGTLEYTGPESLGRLVDALPE